MASRHYALRAAGLRDLLDKECIVAEHIRGVNTVADPLTHKSVTNWSLCNVPLHSCKWAHMRVWLVSSRCA